MFLNVYLRFQDFIFSPKIGYIEEKMKKRPKKMPLSEWKVLLFASKDAPLALLLDSIPAMRSRVTITHDFKKAIAEINGGNYTHVMSDVTQQDPVARRIMTWVHINHSEIETCFLGVNGHPSGEIDIWELSNGKIFTHSMTGVDPLTEPLSVLYSEETPLKWLSHAKCECLQVRERLNPRKNNVVLIMGAGGTGKAVLAQIAHFSSPRCEGLFVFANCSSDSNIPNDTVWTVECENRFRKSVRHMFDQADKGTLYIHDIDKLDRVAQKIMYEEINKVVDAPVADKNPRLIICATNKHLEHEVGNGDFSAELYALISDFIINVPSLSQFKEELPMLADNLLRAYCLTAKISERKFTKDALETIRAHVWDENLRGLYQALKQSYMMADSMYIKPSHMNLTPHLDRNDSLIDQSHSIKTALLNNKGVVIRAAKELGISRSHLYNLMTLLEIPHGFGLPPLKKKQRLEMKKNKNSGENK